MRKTLFTGAALLMLGTLASHAQEVAVVSDLNDGLYEAIEAIAAETPVADVEYADLTGNGQLVALLKFDECDEDGCRWDLLARKAMGFEIVGSSWAKDVSFHETAGGGHVIWSDGATWSYSGDYIMPYGSIIDRMTSRLPRPEEIALATGLNEFWNPEQMRLQVYDVDLVENEWNEKVIIVGGLCCLAGPSGYPFLVTDHLDNVLLQGHSIDPPAVFRTGDGGSLIIPQTVAGYDLMRIKLEETPQNVED